MKFLPLAIFLLATVYGDESASAEESASTTPQALRARRGMAEPIHSQPRLEEIDKAVERKASVEDKSTETQRKKRDTPAEGEVAVEGAKEEVAGSTKCTKAEADQKATTGPARKRRDEVEAAVESASAEAKEAAVSSTAKAVARRRRDASKESTEAKESKEKSAEVALTTPETRARRVAVDDEKVEEKTSTEHSDDKSAEEPKSTTKA